MMIARLLCLAVCALGFSSCATYQTVKVDGKTPIWEFELSEMPKVMQVMTTTVLKYEEEFKALEPGPGERQTGKADVGFYFVGASGVGPDGSIADGYVLREKLKIRTKDKDSPKFLRIKELAEKVRAELLTGLGSIGAPVYVDKAVLD
jgi:hypothetical protein